MLGFVISKNLLSETFKQKVSKKDSLGFTLTLLILKWNPATFRIINGSHSHYMMNETNSSLDAVSI